MQKLSLKSENYNIELDLRSNITIITGDSGTGKTFFYHKMRSIKDRDDIICINYDAVKQKDNYNSMVELVKQSRFKIFVIDNADELQSIDDSLMYAINTDSGTNTFLVIGRNPALVYNISDIAEMKIENHTISLEYLFEEPLM